MKHCACRTNVLASFISSIAGTQIRAASSFTIKITRSQAVSPHWPVNINNTRPTGRRAGIRPTSRPPKKEIDKSTLDARTLKRLEKKERRLKEGTWCPTRKSQRPVKGNQGAANTTGSKTEGKRSTRGIPDAFRYYRSDPIVPEGAGEKTSTPGGRTRFSGSTGRTATARGASLDKDNDRDLRSRPRKSGTPGGRTRFSDSKERIATARGASLDKDNDGDLRNKPRKSDTPSEDDIVASILEDVEAEKQPRIRSTEDTPIAPTFDGRELPKWAQRRNAVKIALGGAAWAPAKRLSPDTLNGIRALRQSDPETYTTKVLCEHFRISAEAMYRILRSKWQPNEAEIEKRRKRWVARGVKKRNELNKVQFRKKSAKIINSIFSPQYEPAIRVKRRPASEDEAKYNF